MVAEKVRNQNVIASDRVEDTDVYGSDNKKMGTVKRIMLDKTSGEVRDVEINVGAFLGMGGEIHSLPWQKLDYNTDLGGYQLNVTEDQLKKAPSQSEAKSDSGYDQDYQDAVYTYWEVDPYWID